MRFRTLAALLLLPLLLLSGCARELPEDGNAPAPGDLAAASAEETPSAALPRSFALAYDPEATLDPITCPDGAQQTLSALLYEGLFQLDQHLEPQYRLCSSADYDPEKRTWTLRLRDGAVFSDGSALTAADAAAALNRARGSARYQARLACVQSVRASGGSVIVTLNRPNAGFTALLDIPIVKSGTETRMVPTGTGPYVLKEENDTRFLTANTNWQGGKLPLSRIELTDCSGTDAVRYQFSSRGIQLMVSDLTGSESLSRAGSFAAQDADTPVLQFLGFNTRRAPLDDPAVRRALSLGIDRDTVTEAYLSGHALAAQFPVSPASSLYPGELDAAYSYPAFQAAMTAAGLNTGEKTRSLTLLVNEENAFKASVARYLADALSVFDIKITVKTLPWAEYTAALAAGNFDLYYGEVRLTADWDLAPLLSSGGTLNYGGWSDPALEEALGAFASAMTDRDGAMKTLCSRLAEQTPLAPVCFKRTSVLYQDGVVENLSPTAADPFYQPENITIHLAS